MLNYRDYKGSWEFQSYDHIKIIQTTFWWLTLVHEDPPNLFQSMSTKNILYLLIVNETHFVMLRGVKRSLTLSDPPSPPRGDSSYTK